MSLLLLTVTLRGYLISIAYCLFFHLYLRKTRISLDNCLVLVMAVLSLDSERPGAGCSKLTTSLVNISLKFKTLIYQIHHYFFHIFPIKNNNVFDNLVGIYLTS